MPERVRQVVELAAFASRPHPEVGQTVTTASFPSRSVVDMKKRLLIVLLVIGLLLLAALGAVIGTGSD
jgi:hypothetical protein